MKLIAIHQPNYLPWLGYFAKIARADVFIFLDDVQYSKNSYINRVQIDADGAPRWLTIPVSYNLGDPINGVCPAADTWQTSHLDVLKTRYRCAPAFDDVYGFLEAAFGRLTSENLANDNAALVREISGFLNLKCEFLVASDIGKNELKGDARLIALLKTVADDPSYLSGKGGANYQDPEKFSAAGIDLIYSDFNHPTYDQGHDFLPGLSVVDALFRVGPETTASYLVQ